MSKSKPPLFDFFIFMRESADLPLTIDQYHLLLQALKGGFGISSRNELKQICRLLWIKSKSSLQVERFEKCFEQYFRQNSQNQEPEFEKQEFSPTTTSILQQQISPTSPLNTSKTPETQTSESSKSDLLNSPQIVKAIRGKLLPESPFGRGIYQLIPQDFPLTRRQIQQNWRYLRRPIREGTLTEIDIEATVKRIMEDGVFLEPALIPSRVNQVEMLLLIDESNSMVPFHLFSERIVASLQESRLKKADIYYFRNCPSDYLFLYPRSPDAKKINEILPKLHSHRTVVLIISDGGAARGGINWQRIELTAEFLEQFTPYVRHIAWLNPMPSERWKYNSAEAISQLVQMFELNYQGLKAVVRSLKV
ncbi:MAG: hypothetical protein AAF378_04245 [Cyanobacteria bacterium P01_A01_bin.84]